MDLAYRLEPGYYENEDSDLDEVDRLLSESTEDEKQRIKNQIQKIEREIKEREQIKERREEKLNEQIRHQENRLTKAQKPDEDEVRDRLEQLYIEKRELPRKKWLDTQNLKEKKRELERELQEIEDSDKFEDMLDAL